MASPDIARNGLDISGENNAYGMVFDSEALRNRLFRDDAMVEAVLAVFVEDIPRQITALREMSTAGDLAGAKRQAHTIKGAAANVGAVALSGIAERIERLCAAGEMDSAAKLLPDLDAIWTRTLSVIVARNPATGEAT